MGKTGRISRVKSGCLCCRKRKVKCDEAKPTCNTCDRLALVCEWQNPVMNVTNKWLAEYTPRKRKKRIQFVNVNCELHSTSFPTKIEDEAVVAELPQEIEVLPKDYGKIRRQTKSEVDVDQALRNYLRELGSSYVKNLSLRGLTNVHMTQMQAMFFDAFVNGFMVAISPQLAHEKLQPPSVVIPRGINDPILMKVFYACGATYLSWNNKEYKAVAESEYQESMTEVRSQLNTNDFMDGNESNILIMMVTLCLREKYQCNDRVRNSLFLIASIKIIYYWINTKRRNERHLETDVIEEYLEGCMLKKELLEIIDTLSTRIYDRHDLVFHDLQSQDAINDEINLVLESERDSILHDIAEESPASSLGISAFERTMVESFLYNYCVNLLNFDREMLTYTVSPFVLFRDLGPYLTKPIYNTPVYWMNNPIMGASLSAFELVSKANWLRLKMPLNKQREEAAKRLRNIARFYIPSLLPESAKFNLPDHIQKKLTESCFVGVLAAKASYILLTKIIYPNYTLKSVDIQEAIDTFFRYLERISVRSQTGGICLWPFIICGLVLEDVTKREYLLYRITAFSETKKSEAQLRLVGFLKDAWGSHEGNAEAWEIMCDANGFKSIFV